MGLKSELAVAISCNVSEKIMLCYDYIPTVKLVCKAILEIPSLLHVTPVHS